jgi:hypothetical protein
MDTKIMVVGSEKTKNVKRQPRIRLAGFWLNDIGFKPDSIATIEYESKSILLKVQGSGLDTYKSFVRYARANKAGLLQVKEECHNKKCTPHLEVKGFWLEMLGFTIGSHIVVKFEYGSINIRLLELEKFGF